MLDSSRHDAETFRVAEELIMLSSRAAAASPLGESGDSPSNISGFCEHRTKGKRTPKVKVKARAKRSLRTPAAPSAQKVKKRSSRGVAHKSSDRDSTKQESAQVAPDQSADIINSRCDVSLSELLKEHRVRFRRVRRRWNIEQRTKNQEYLARFHVQGIPLVQHLEALTHWRTNCGARTATAAKDKTALEIAANEALFGGGDASSMGNYDRDSHLRMQLPSHRVKAAAPPSNTSGNNPNTGPYFHHFLERSSSANSSANSLLFAPSNSYADAAPPNTSGKRPRPGNINSISNSNSNNNGNFLGAFGGYPSPPPFDADHPLPDFITNWGFTSRAGAKGNSAISTAPIVGGSSATTTSSHSSSHVTTSSSLSGIGSPNAASMFASVDSFLPDYDSSLYSLWNAPGGYDTENDAAQGQQQQEQVQPPLYMASEDELKMDYPQLPEFNQDLDSYLNDTMDSGGPSPTTPLGTSTGHNSSGMMKMDHLVTTDRRTGGSNLTMGTQLERLLAPAAPTSTLTSTAMATATPGYLKRDRGEESTSGRSVKRSCGAFDDAYATDAPASSGAVTGTSANDNASSFKTTMIEPKRALMPSLGSFHTGTSFLMPTPAVSSQVEAPSPSTAVISTTTVVTPTSAASDTAGTKGSKRPRSRQCEFPGCQNRARSHQKCKKHGGAHQCVFEGCTKNSQSRGLCIAHGGGSRCTHEGCVRAAQSKGLCKSHGGGEYCAVEGCRKKAHLKHLCRTHGGGVRCKVEKCLKWAQRKGWCMAHAKEFSAT
ncbi:WRKY transcription factor 19 [Phytophthora cinnamomi]|uniref:WRKY transcription factor 19 n=2 Tax=Phytophthora cinnamomi TaxID=4785 RepID=UPI003559E661|nr:WRKY transcription factor 19 [Phytophthora cinnamomi]